MNIRMVGRLLGYMLWIEAAFMLPAALVGGLYREVRPALSMLLGAALCAAVGLVLFLACRCKKTTIYAREGFVVAGIGWILLSVFGAFPFMFSGDIPHFVDAVFEAVSGFTTTGASILYNAEEMSHALLFWRSFTHWLGGVGVLAFLLMLLRAQKGAGSMLHLLRAETPGPSVGKMAPRMHDSARTLYTIYIGLSVLNLVFLLVGRMPLFDALCTMFGTAGTGGFGVRADSMASYSPYIQNVTAVFMALFGVNFTLYFLLMRREWKAVLRDEELHLYIGIMLGSIALIALNIRSMFATIGGAVHHAGFTVSSVMTTTGYSTENFDMWPQFSRALLLVLMIVGSMAGSTGGGLKNIRLLILLKSFRAKLHQLLHPRSVKGVRINGKTVDDSVVNGVYFYTCMYAVIALVSVVLISVDNLPLPTNISAMLACLNNIGPGLGMVGPAYNFSVYSYFSKAILSINMLLGRLEIFPILLLLSPATWRKKT